MPKCLGTAAVEGLAQSSCSVDVCLMKANPLVPEDTAAFTEMVICLWQAGVAVRQQQQDLGSNPQNPFFPEDPMALRIEA